MSHNRGMDTTLTRDDIARLVREVPVAELAREASVSTKTIYRLRHKQHSPNLATVEQIVAALRRINARQPAAKKAA